MENSSNVSGPVVTRSDKIINTSFLIVVIVVTVIGNIIALAAFWISYELKKVTNYFIVNLCLSDLMVASISMPFWITYVTTGWPGVENGGKVYTFWICLDIFCSTWSIMSLSMISIERYLCIVYPLTYQNLLTKRSSFFAILFVILYSQLASWFGFYQQQHINDPKISLSIFFLSYLFPVVIKAYSYNRIYIEARAQQRQILKLERIQGYFVGAERGSSAKREDSSTNDSILKRHHRQSDNCSVPLAGRAGCNSRKRGQLWRLLHSRPLSKEQKNQHKSRSCGGKREEIELPSLDDEEARNMLSEEEGSRGQSLSPSKSCNRAIQSIREDQLSKDKESQALAFLGCEPSPIGKLEFWSGGKGKCMNKFFTTSTDSARESCNKGELSLSPDKDTRTILRQLSPKKHFGPRKSHDDTSMRSNSFNSTFSFNKLYSSSSSFHEFKTKSLQRFRQFRKELKAAKTVGLIMGTFLLLWTPFMIVVLLSSININPTMRLIMVLKDLHYANSAINPILYVALNKAFRTGTKRVLYKLGLFKRRDRGLRI